jgi:hypothetical protein
MSDRTKFESIKMLNTALMERLGEVTGNLIRCQEELSALRAKYEGVADDKTDTEAPLIPEAQLSSAEDVKAPIEDDIDLPYPFPESIAEFLDGIEAEKVKV